MGAKQPRHPIEPARSSDPIAQRRDSKIEGHGRRQDQIAKIGGRQIVSIPDAECEVSSIVRDDFVRPRAHGHADLAVVRGDKEDFEIGSTDLE